MDTFIKLNTYLLSNGINIIAIILTILFVHGIKTALNNFTFYNDKSKTLINLFLGLIVSFIICFSINQFKTHGIVIDTLLGAGLSVYSREIMDGVSKFFAKKEQ